MKDKKSIFRTGDKVYDIRQGWGEVVELINIESFYPVVVDFGWTKVSYTLCGKPWRGGKKNIIIYRIHF